MQHDERAKAFTEVGPDTFRQAHARRCSALAPGNLDDEALCRRHEFRSSGNWSQCGMGSLTALIFSHHNAALISLAINVKLLSHRVTERLMVTNAD